MVSQLLHDLWMAGIIQERKGRPGGQSTKQEQRRNKSSNLRKVLSGVLYPPLKVPLWPQIFSRAKLLLESVGYCTCKSEHKCILAQCGIWSIYSLYFSITALLSYLNCTSAFLGKSTIVKCLNIFMILPQFFHKVKLFPASDLKKAGQVGKLASVLHCQVPANPVLSVVAQELRTISSIINVPPCGLKVYIVTKHMGSWISWYKKRDIYMPHQTLKRNVTNSWICCFFFLQMECFWYGHQDLNIAWEPHLWLPAGHSCLKCATQWQL